MLRVLPVLATGLLAIACSRTPAPETPPAAAAQGPDGSTVALDAPEEHLTGVVAQVNGRTIHWALYEKSLNFIRDHLTPGTGQAGIERYIKARTDALDRLVNDELIAQQAEKEGRAPTDEEVRAEYQRLVTQAGGEARLIKMLKADHMTKWEAIDGIRRRLAVDRFVKERVMPAQSVSEEEVLHYYNANLAKFTPDLWVKLYQILVRCPAGASPERVEAARARALKILANLRSGAPFEVMAREFSEDGPSARLGGSMGFVKQGALPDVLDAVAFSIALDVPSDVLQSEEGFHILKVTERHGGTVKPFEEVRGVCEKALMTAKQAGAIEDLASRLRETARIETYLTQQPD